MKKRWHFSVQIHFSFKLSSVKCTFDNCVEIFALKKKKIFSNLKIDEKNKNFSKINIKLCSGDAKGRFVRSAGKRSSEVINSCALNPEMLKKVMFVREHCFVSKKVLCAIRWQIWRPCRTVPTIVRHNFCHNPQKGCRNCYIFQRKNKISSNDRLYTWNTVLTTAPKHLR